MNKTNTLLAILFCFSFLFSNGQKNVVVKINHLQSGQSFALDQVSQNNNGYDHKFKRLQYYLSNFSIVHDGGTETHLDSVWALVNANNQTEVDLGEINLSTVEEIKFGVGVEQEFNHVDPALFPVSHPLGPKSPSMHWGWSAGYRFAAVEGYGGSSVSNLFEFHALGDNNYFITTIDNLSIDESGNTITINLDADCDMILKDIDVRSGKIVHGSTGDAVNIMQNFQNNVFSPSTGTANVEEVSSFKLNVFPNPTYGVFNVSAPIQQFPLTLTLSDVTGKMVLNQIIQNPNSPINIEFSGLYIAQFTTSTGVQFVEKLIVK